MPCAPRVPPRASTIRRSKPVMALLYRLLARRDLTEIELDKPGFRLALRRTAAPVRA